VLKLAFVASGLCIAGRVPDFGPLLLALGCVAWIELIVACAVRVVVVRVRPSRQDALPPVGIYRRWRALTGLLLLLAPLVTYGTGTFASDTCPHALYWSVGPIGLAHSTVGGPCRNHGGGVHLFGQWWLTGPQAISPYVRYGGR
jgi:hypothetical protein